MRRSLVYWLVSVLLVAAAPTMASAPSAVGLWETVDDVSGKPRSHVRIYEQNGVLYGRVDTLIEPAEPDPRCDKCKGERKGQRVKGMVIITGMKATADGWSGGRILDPESGNEYGCKLKLTAEGRKLQVRGFLGISLLGRTQVWNRIE